jgi:hypothetical protein
MAGTAVNGTIVNGTVVCRTVVDGTVAGRGLPGYAVPARTVPDGTIPDGTVPDGTIRGRTVPGRATRSRAIAGGRADQAQQLGEEPPELGVVRRVVHNNSCTVQPHEWYSRGVTVAPYNSLDSSPARQRHARRRAGSRAA